MYMWLVDRLKDVFYDASNNHLDIGRCLAYWAMLTLVGATVWNMHMHLEIKLGELGAALTAVLGGLVAYIYHDRKTNGS